MVLVASVATAAELELNVSDEKTLSQALAALSPALTISDINGGSYAAYDIVKTGSGTLTFDTALPNWTGSLGVTNGVVVAIPVAQTVLGSTSAGAVWVSSGTTIVIDDSDGASRANNSLAPKRPIHLAGTGASGYYGAIKIINNASYYRSCLPHNLVLEADTTMCFGNVDHKDAINYVLDTSGGAKTIDQQGKYVLTLTKQGATRVPKFLWAGGNFVNPYRIVHDGVLFDNRGSSFSGGAENIVTLRNGADLIYEDNVGQPWMLIVENTAGKLEINVWKNYEVTTDRRMWKGPVTLEKPLTVSMGGSAVTNSVGFAGKVSGSGGFNSSVATGKKYWFFLMNPDNDFTGGVALTNLTLGVGAATAIPSGAGAGPLELVDSTVGLYGGLPSFAFPDTTFIGTGAIVGSSSLSVGTVRSLTKKGAGTLSVGAHLTAGDVTLAGGTLSLPSDIRRRSAGLYHGTYKVPDSHDSVWGNALTEPDLQYTMSNSVVTTMPQFFHVSTYPAPGDEVNWRDDKTIDTFWANTYYHQYCTYDGFIWNNSPTTETWSVICALNAYTYMTVNDKEYRAETTDGRNYGGPSGTYPDGNAVGKLWTVTLHPGPNAFRIRQYHRWNTPGVWYGNICTNLAVGTPFTYWEDGNGLMVDKKGRGTTDMRNYERMEDPGDGSLFTCVDFSQTDFGHTFQTVRGQGGTLDLNGGVAYAQAVEGAPKVVNGMLKVDGPGGAAASLELGEGTFALPSEADLRKRAAGLYVGSVTSTTRTQPAYTDCITYTNGVVYELDYFYTAPSKWGNYPYVTYDGYLWNTTGVDQVWTVMSVQNGMVKFAINGVSYSTTDQWDGCWTKPDLARKMWTDVTVPPGANRFTVYSAAQYVVNGQYVGNICTNGIDWTSDFGLAYDPQNRGSTDYRDYKKFETPRDGSLFTRTADFSLSYGTVSGVAGSVLDLGGRDDFVVPALEGVVVASNGTLTVTNSWTLTAAQVMSPAAVAEGVVFAPGTVFSMTAGEVAQLVKTQTGYVVARDWSGTVPKTADLTRSAGWVLRERDGDLKVVRESGVFIIFR